MQTVSERSAWIRRGWEDEWKGWPVRLDVPKEHQAAYLLGRRRMIEFLEAQAADGREQG